MLMSQMEQQARNFNTDIRMGAVTDVDFSKEPGGWHTVTVDGEKKIQARTVIIATGASARWLGIPTEQKYRASAYLPAPPATASFSKAWTWQL